MLNMQNLTNALHWIMDVNTAASIPWEVMNANAESALNCIRMGNDAKVNLLADCLCFEGDLVIYTSSNTHFFLQTYSPQMPAVG